MTSGECISSCYNGPLTRYVKLRVAHAPGMPGTFSPTAEFKGNRELAIPACMKARACRTCRDACRDCLLAVAGKTFPAFPAHAHPQFDVFRKRPMTNIRSFWSLLPPSFHKCLILYIFKTRIMGFELRVSATAMFQDGDSFLLNLAFPDPSLISCGPFLVSWKQFTFVDLFEHWIGLTCSMITKARLNVYSATGVRLIWCPHHCWAHTAIRYQYEINLVYILLLCINNMIHWSLVTQVCQWSQFSMVRLILWLLLDTKPKAEPILASCQLDHYE